MRNQSKLLLDFETRIPRRQDEIANQARLAAIRRSKRVGRYALSKRVKGFNQAIDNLWIPYSEGENTSVIHAPEPKIAKDKYQAKKRVEEKYKDSEVSKKSVRAWANFAASNSEKAARERLKGYKLNANLQIRNLAGAFIDRDLNYTESSISESELAIDGISWYLISLKSFGGKDEDGQEFVKRRWVQPRWTKVVKEEKDRAEEFISNMNNEELFLTFEEAYYNNWCRRAYWQAVEDDYRAHLKEISNQEPERVEVPLEAYQGYYF